MGGGWAGRAQWQARGRSGMDVQRLPGERQVSLADGLGLGRVGVDELRHL